MKLTANLEESFLTGSEGNEAMEELAIFPCDICEYKANVPKDLKRHRDSFHVGEPHKCDLCDYKASLDWNLRRHKDNVHGHQRFACDQCDFAAGRNKYLKTHKEYAHRDKLMQYCDLCIFLPLFSFKKDLPRVGCIVVPRSFS